MEGMNKYKLDWIEPLSSSQKVGLAKWAGGYFAKPKVYEGDL